MNCQIAEFLKQKLSTEDFEELCTLLTQRTTGLESINTLKLEARARNCLVTGNIRTIRDLVTLTEAELLQIPNLGRRSLNEIKEALASRGLQLKS